MILDILGDSGSATAVDVSQHRLAACRTMLQKYSLGDRCRLFVADGTTFTLVPTKQPNYVHKACNPHENLKLSLLFFKKLLTEEW